MKAAPITPPSDAPECPSARLRVGTLQYTAKSLAVLCFWMLWGDFSYTLMETVVGTIMPLRLKALGATSLMLALVLSTVPRCFHLTLFPVISTWSDRFRSRLGRRIPFLMVGTLLVSTALVLLAFAPELGACLHRTVVGKWARTSPETTMLFVLAGSMIFFASCNVIIEAMFIYILNDVVPMAFMGRFLGLYRAVGSVAGFLFNWFVFPHALTHTREIFIGAALLYFTALALVCWKVKEGKYPPPPPKPVGKRIGSVAKARTYLKECTGHRMYWYFYFSNATWGVANACNMYVVFMRLSLGLDLRDIGKISAIIGGATALLTYPAGMLADRYHPVRMLCWMKIAVASSMPLGLVWLFTSFSPRVNFYIVMGLSLVQFPLILLYVASWSPAAMQILPKNRFGQYFSCSVMFGSAATLVSGLAAGAFLDLMRRFFPDETYGKDFCYRFIPVWQTVFFGISLVTFLLLYREWKRLGGRGHYHPPGYDPVAESTDPPESLTGAAGLPAADEKAAE